MNIPRACCTRDGDLELRREKLSSLFILAGLKLKEKENTCTYITFYLSLHVSLYTLHKLLKLYILPCLNNVHRLVVDCVNLVKTVECGFSFSVLD